MLTKTWTYFQTALQDQRDRWILWTPVALAAGIGVYFSLPSEPPALTGVLLLAATLLPLPAFYKNKPAVLAWLVLFLAVAGFAAAQFGTQQAASPVLHKKTQALTVRGRIIDVDALEKSYRVTLDELSFTETPPQDPMPQRVRIKLKNNDAAIPQAGDVVEIKAILSPLPTPVLPGAYDFQRFAWFKHLGSTGFALSDMTVVTAHETDFFFEDLRRVIRERVAAANLSTPEIAALTTAFLIGDAGAISKHDWDVARRSGIAHLIAISGSHFAMIVGVVFFMIRGGLAAFPYAALRWPVKKIAAVAAMFVAVFYMLLIGSPIPAQRAVVMACGILLAVVLDRDPLTLRIAALAAFVVLLIAPESLTGASFQMSFAAVIGLVSFFESTREWRIRHLREAGPLKKTGLFLLSCFMTTAAATVATAPYSLYHFLHVYFLAGLVANMIAVPLSSFVTFPMGLFACLLMPFHLEKFPLWITEKSIEIIMQVAETVAAWPHTGFSAGAWPACWLVAITLGGLWICLWRGKIRWLGLAPILVAAIVIPLRPRPDILIGGHFKLLAAVRGDSGALLLSPGRGDKFVRNAWIEREGGDGTGPWPEDACGPRVCTFKIKGRTVVFNKQSDFHPKPGEEFDPQAASEDCQAADLLILPAAKAPQDCKAVVIDKWALYDNGAHIVYLNPLSIVSTADTRGDRPWTGKRHVKNPAID